MSESEFSILTQELREFTAARKWEKFHSPKNLSMAIAGEAGELVSELRWLTENESRLENLKSEKLHSIALEIADVQILLLQMADVLDLNIPEIVCEKIEINKNRRWETDDS